MMLNTYYQGSRPNGFRQADFLCFSYISLCKTCHFWPNNGELITKILRQLFLLFVYFSLLKPIHNEGSIYSTYLFH